MDKILEFLKCFAFTLDGLHVVALILRPKAFNAIFFISNDLVTSNKTFRVVLVYTSTAL